MYILYMFVLNNTPFVHAHVYLQYLKSALPESIPPFGDHYGCVYISAIVLYGMVVEEGINI